MFIMYLKCVEVLNKNLLKHVHTSLYFSHLSYIASLRQTFVSLFPSHAPIRVRHVMCRQSFTSCVFVRATERLVGVTQHLSVSGSNHIFEKWSGIKDPRYVFDLSFPGWIVDTHRYILKRSMPFSSSLFSNIRWEIKYLHSPSNSDSIWVLWVHFIL